MSYSSHAQTIQNSVCVCCVCGCERETLAYKIGDLNKYIAIDVIEFARTHNTELRVCCVCGCERGRLAYKIGDVNQLTHEMPYSSHAQTLQSFVCACAANGNVCSMKAKNAIIRTATMM